MVIDKCLASGMRRRRHKHDGVAKAELDGLRHSYRVLE